MTAHPAVDVLTDRVAVVMQDRPVVALGSWLADVIRICADNGKGLQLVTPAATRLTTALYAALDGPDTRWVVHTPDGHHDGQSGRPLGWNGAAFVPVDPPALSPRFTDGPAAPAWHLTVTLQVRHPVSARLLLGGAMEDLFVQLTGRPPAGWGTAEPATQPWDRHTLTDLCRERAPRRTWLCAVGTGAPALATMVVSRPAESVLETIRCTVVRGEPLEADALTDAGRGLAAAYDVRQMLVQQAPGQADTTHASHWTGLGAPLALLAGAEAVAGRRGEDLRSVGAISASRLGSGAYWYALHSYGEDPAQAWSRLEQVIAHLSIPSLSAQTPRRWGQPEARSNGLQS
ncbi:DUF6177 family protein [Couchioplanes caeruleus]|uniref:Uncharacterized protein n=1 Tax=Couchioplanes caeruleus subsp. caeruleus TaxID=56427 RepID=A0A1K0GUE5_9ACTN|nr:DUF6177 family protein [Couchioplanes caeruleus]OJF14940.1 hypothetical protein BG844_07015 [Couchioplanes caeruleus subsp. caeruleus]